LFSFTYSTTPVGAALAASRSGRCRSRAAATKLRTLLGEQNVLVKAEQLISYNKIMMSMENAAHAPAAAL